MSGHRRVLLLGASGFLGEHVAAALERDPRAGTVVRAGRQQRGAGWVSQDLVALGTPTLAVLIRSVQADAVISCVGRLSGDNAQLAETNVVVTARLIEAVVRAAPAARLVVLGSAAEYGAVPFGRRVTEDDDASPLTPYGVTRLASTQLLRMAVSAGRLDGVVLRIFNPIGPQAPPGSLLGRAAAALRAAMASGEPTVRLGPLGAHRDFVDVRDVASAICAAALAGRVGEPVLNVGSGRPARCRDVVSELGAIAGYTGRIDETAAPSERSGQVDWSAADISRIRRTLGWAPSYGLGESLEACWHSSEPVSAAPAAG